MIIIYLRGGLGNQLFQIYTGINYALENNHKFYFSDKHYQKYDEKTTIRKTYWDNLFLNLKKYINNNEEKINKFKEESFLYQKIPNNLGNTYLIGYFQSYKYFYDNYHKISEIIDINNTQLKIKNKFKFDYKNLCSIHFRFGDYKKYPDYHLNLEKNYFLQATNLIFQEKAKKNFLIFYEQEDKLIVEKIINYIKENNKKIREFIFIDTSIPDYEQLLIMSCCHSNIISNSSFSWWGAFFNNNKDKLVIRPSKWFGTKMNHNNISDLCPTEWKIINI